MKRIKHVEKYIREKYHSLAAKFRRLTEEKQRTTDFGHSSEPHTIMLRERTWRIEMSRSKAKRFWRQHKIAIVATMAVLFTGILTRYVLIGFASTVDFYPSSCLGNWENVQNALGKPDLGPGSSPSAFTTLNSAVFGTSTAQMFCGNFSGDTDINTLTGKSFQEADLVLSWSVVFPQDAQAISGGGGGSGGDTASDDNSSTTDGTIATSSASSTIDATADASGTIASSTDASSSASASLPPVPPPTPTSTPAPSPAPAAGSSSDSVATPPPTPVPTPTSIPAPSPASADTSSDSTDTTTPAPPPPAPAPTPTSDPSSPATSWLRQLVGVAFADETSSIAVDASTTELADSSTPSSTTLTVTSSAQEGTPTEPQPAPINVNTSVFQNIILPSSTADDALAIVYSTDGVTWQPLVNINSSNWQQERYQIPIHSWTELEHLQVAFVGLGASSSPQIFLDAAGVEVSYIDTPVATTDITSSTDSTDQGDADLGSPGEGSTATSSWTPPADEVIIQKPTISETDVFEQGAHQQCVVAPFSEPVAPGASASFSLQLFSGLAPTSTQQAVYQTQVGSLPVGISATIVDGKASNTSSTQSIHVTASASAPAGSYSVLVLYRERQDDASMRSTGCQMNVVVQ
jgi:hypothetical protein